jgi:hypothetical protein
MWRASDKRSSNRRAAAFERSFAVDSMTALS